MNSVNYRDIDQNRSVIRYQATVSKSKNGTISKKLKKQQSLRASSKNFKPSRMSEQLKKAPEQKPSYKEQDTIKSADFGRMDSEINYEHSPSNHGNENAMVDRGSMTRGSMRTVESQMIDYRNGAPFDNSSRRYTENSRKFYNSEMNG